MDGSGDFFSCNELDASGFGELLSIVFIDFKIRKKSSCCEGSPNTMEEEEHGINYCKSKKKALLNEQQSLYYDLFIEVKDYSSTTSKGISMFTSL